MSTLQYRYDTYRAAMEDIGLHEYILTFDQWVLNR